MVNRVAGKSFLECLLIRDFNVCVSFPFSRTWASDQRSFSRTTSLLVFAVLKTVLPFWYDGYWVKWNVKNLPLFFLPKGKISQWQQDHLHNVIIFIRYPIRIYFSQTIWKWDHENLRKLSPPVPRNPVTLLQVSKKKRLSLSLNKSMFLIFVWN